MELEDILAFASEYDRTTPDVANQRSQPDFHRRYQMSEIMTIKEVSEYLRIHPTTAYRLIKKGAIPSFQVGSDHRFLRSEIDRYARGEWKRSDQS